MNSLLTEGIKVTVASTPDQYMDRLKEAGISGFNVPYARGGFHLIHDPSAAWALRKCVQLIRPGLVHCFQPKPLLSCAFGAGLSDDIPLVATITGLGALHESLISSTLAPFVRSALRKALRRCECVIFQNPDDRDLFLKLHIVDGSRCTTVPGSGVDLKRFKLNRLGSWVKTGPIRVLMASRLLWNKGVAEYYQAAKLCRDQFPQAVFEIAGELDKRHHEAVPLEWFLNPGNRSVAYLGYISDMASKLSEVDVLVLPSSYREGVPRILLEGAACGIPVITTDAPGCRETVQDGKTGFLVPPRDARSLARALETLLSDPDLRIRMGQAGRRFVEKNFDLQRITAFHLSLYRDLGLRISIEADDGAHG